MGILDRSPSKVAPVVRTKFKITPSIEAYALQKVLQDVRSSSFALDYELESCMSYADLLRLPNDAQVLGGALEQLVFGRHFDEELISVWWPRGLKRIVFQKHFNQSLDNVTWPPTLVELVLGAWFNHSLDGARWPSHLKKLVLGVSFNQPISQVICVG